MEHDYIPKVYDDSNLLSINKDTKINEKYFIYNKFILDKNSSKIKDDKKTQKNHDVKAENNKKAQNDDNIIVLPIVVENITFDKQYILELIERNIKKRFNDRQRKKKKNDPSTDHDN